MMFRETDHVFCEHPKNRGSATSATAACLPAGEFCEVTVATSKTLTKSKKNSQYGQGLRVFSTKIIWMDVATRM